MNKSKFLKKSLAMILAVMMVVAMIPLSASAANEDTVWLNKDGIQEFATAANNVLTKSADGVYTNSLNYALATTETDDTLTITFLDGYTQLFYKATDADGVKDEEYTKATSNTINVTYGTKSVEFFAAKTAYSTTTDKAEDKGATYTVNYEQTKASSSYALASASIGTADADKVAGTINNSAKTVNFTLPWGYDLTTQGGAVTAVMEYPGATAATVTITALDTKTNMPVYNQAGGMTNYTVVATEEESVTGFTVGGVAAVQDVDTAGKVKPGEYTVTLPVGTDLTKAQAVKYTMKTGATAVKHSATTLQEDTSSAVAFTNGSEITLKNNSVYTLSLTSTKNYAKTFKLTVKVGQSTDAGISAFTATAAVSLPTGSSTVDVTENGTVNGDQLTVTLPKNADLTTANLNFTVATGATVAVNGTAYTNGTAIDLSAKTFTVKVTAADGTTSKVYKLTVDKATATSGKPAISAAKMNVTHTGATANTEYTATVAGNVITFNGLPYATTQDEIVTFSGSTATVVAEFAWTKTVATNVGDIKWNTNDKSDIFEGTNTVSVTADNGEVATYTIKFVKEAAKTEKAITSLKLTTAAKEEKVTDKNTWNVSFSGKTATITLPASFETGASTNVTTKFAPIFTVSDGAKVYFNDFTTTANLNKTAIESGFNAADATSHPEEPKTQITLKDLVTGYSSTDGSTSVKLVVANEKAAYEVNAATGDIAVATDLVAKPYKNNVTVYNVVVKYATAKNDKSLTSITSETNKITSKVSGAAVELTVPFSKIGVGFYADVVAGDMATVQAVYGTGNVVLGDFSAYEATDVKIGQLQVVDGATAGTYKLQVNTADTTADWEDVTSIKVVAESGEYETYTVTAKVAEAKTGADLTALTANGVNAAIDTTARTATVTLPFGTDLSDVVVSYTVSEMATKTTSITPITDSAKADHYDLTNGMDITVTSEDSATIKVYKVVVNVASQFTDVPATAWYAEAVYAAASAEIVKGFPNGTFQPTGKITRADFAIMVARLLKADTSKYTTSAFKDVPNTHYAVGAIAYCTEQGIVNGIGENFEPKRTITREEAATMMARALELTSTATTTNFKDDAAIQNYAKASVAACAAAGIMTGDNGSFRPADTLTRAEAAQIMVNVLNK